MKKLSSDTIFSVCNGVLAAILMGLAVYPLIFVLSASFSNPDIVNSGGVFLLPKGFNLNGYVRILQYQPIWIGYRNTIFYTVAGTTLNLFVTLTCAYSLSRKDFRIRGIVTGLFTVTMFFTGGLIPTFLVVRGLGLYDTPLALILPVAASTWNIIITRTFFQTSIPYEVQESAFIDGCSDFRLFGEIILPLSMPIIAVMALYYAVGHWNTYFSALIYLNRRELFPLQLFLREILVLNQMTDISTMTTEEMETLAQRARLAETMKYGIIVVSTLPMMLAYPFLQKYFVKGLTIGAVKG